ncbi:unnamed protein product [Oppiella nova]|uniref:Flavin-containing monooxygenase n=1 Tax=Oppiella nova TaxID=334625 RepID=A0A7R9QQP5_9ACAR|nr:unnamed protein product [Oppiella nova]CAG2170766.1 unnamed protein product [Oppiella nova]
MTVSPSNPPFRGKIKDPYRLSINIHHILSALVFALRYALSAICDSTGTRTLLDNSNYLLGNSRLISALFSLIGLLVFSIAAITNYMEWTGSHHTIAFMNHIKDHTIGQPLNEANERRFGNFANVLTRYLVNKLFIPMFLIFTSLLLWSTLTSYLNHESDCPIVLSIFWSLVTLSFSYQMFSLAFIELLSGADIGYYCLDLFPMNTYEFYEYCSVDYVKYRHDVVRVEHNHDYESTGRWRVTVRDNNNEGAVSEEVFDGVMVCTGHHGKPLMPTLPDQHLFRDEIVHSQGYREPDGYAGKRVVVVGVGHSGGDASVELSRICQKVRKLFSYIIELISAIFHMDVDMFQLKPKHRFLSQHTLVSEYLPLCIHTVPYLSKAISTGSLPMVSYLRILRETSETPCDAVLLSTGYKLWFPFLSPKIIRVDGNPPTPHSLAFIGLVQPLGTLFPLSEIQARLFAQLMAKKSRLPSREVMSADIEIYEEKRIQFVDSDRHELETN